MVARGGIGVLGVALRDRKRCLRPTGRALIASHRRHRLELAGVEPLEFLGEGTGLGELLGIDRLLERRDEVVDVLRFGVQEDLQAFATLGPIPGCPVKLREVVEILERLAELVGGIKRFRGAS